MRPDRKARDAADSADVEIRTYEVIYKLLEEIEQAMVGMLAPEFEEVVTGEAEVREIFRVPRVGAIAGCYVRSGVITRGSKVRFLRDGTIIWKGEISSLKRFKDDAREVREGFECGIGLSDFQDLKQGDLIETFEEQRSSLRTDGCLGRNRPLYTHRLSASAAGRDRRPELGVVHVDVEPTRVCERAGRAQLRRR